MKRERYSQVPSLLIEPVRLAVLVTDPPFTLPESPVCALPPRWGVRDDSIPRTSSAFKELEEGKGEAKTSPAEITSAPSARTKGRIANEMKGEVQSEDEEDDAGCGGLGRGTSYPPAKEADSQLWTDSLLCACAFSKQFGVGERVSLARPVSRSRYSGPRRPYHHSQKCITVSNPRTHQRLDELNVYSS